MAYYLLKERFGVSFPYFSHHNADAIEKVCFLNVWKNLRRKPMLRQKIVSENLMTFKE